LVKATTEHIAEQLSAEENGQAGDVADCMSAVSGFEEAFQSFIAAMQTVAPGSLLQQTS